MVFAPAFPVFLRILNARKAAAETDVDIITATPVTQEFSIPSSGASPPNAAP